MKDKIKDIYTVSFQAIREMPFFLKLITIFCLFGLFFIAGAIFPIGNYEIYDGKVTYIQFWTSGAGVIFLITGVVLLTSGVGFIKKCKWARILFLALLPIQIVLMSLMKLGTKKEIFELFISFILLLFIVGLYLFRRRTVRDYFKTKIGI